MTRSERLAEEIWNVDVFVSPEKSKGNVAKVLRRALEELREECAKVCDNLENQRGAFQHSPSPADCASSIRKLEVQDDTNDFEKMRAAIFKSNAH